MPRTIYLGGVKRSSEIGGKPTRDGRPLPKPKRKFPHPQGQETNTNKGEIMDSFIERLRAKQASGYKLTAEQQRLIQLESAPPRQHKRRRNVGQVLVQPTSRHVMPRRNLRTITTTTNTVPSRQVHTEQEGGASLGRVEQNANTIQYNTIQFNGVTGTSYNQQDPGGEYHTEYQVVDGAQYDPTAVQYENDVVYHDNNAMYYETSVPQQQYHGGGEVVYGEQVEYVDSNSFVVQEPSVYTTVPYQQQSYPMRSPYNTLQGSIINQDSAHITNRDVSAATQRYQTIQHSVAQHIRRPQTVLRPVAGDVSQDYGDTEYSTVKMQRPVASGRPTTKRRGIRARVELNATRRGRREDPRHSRHGSRPSRQIIEPTAQHVKPERSHVISTRNVRRPRVHQVETWKPHSTTKPRNRKSQRRDDVGTSYNEREYKAPRSEPRREVVRSAVKEETPLDKLQHGLSSSR